MNEDAQNSAVTIDALEAAIARCRDAQLAWQGQPVKSRLAAVRAFRRALVDECEAVCAAIGEDVGKPPAEAIGAEILPLADACRFLEKEARSVLRSRKVPRRTRPLWLVGQRDDVHRRPRGVVAVIGTWNYPLMLNGVQILQALTAGNGVVWKPSELAPASAKALARLLGVAGYPNGLIQVMAPTREGGPALIEADIDHLVFTGAAATGRIIARRLGERLISSTMELSGCDALFVLEDADVDLAARAIWFGSTLNRGQTCLAVRRAFVDRAVLGAVVDNLRALSEHAAAVHLAMPAQIEQAVQLIEDAVARGARTLNESDPIASATEMRPAILLDVPADAMVCREASFAPLTAILPFESLPAAVEMDRQCPYGLGGSIFSRDVARARELAESLSTGSVNINDAIAPTAHPGSPFGGRRASGWGVTQGAEGLLEMTVPQVVSERGGRYRPHYDLAAGSGVDAHELLLGTLQMTRGGSLGRKWRGFWKMIRGYRALRRSRKNNGEHE